MYQILEGEEDIDSENMIPEDLTLNDMTFFKYTPIITVDVKGFIV